MNDSPAINKLYAIINKEIKTIEIYNMDIYPKPYNN